MDDFPFIIGNHQLIHKIKALIRRLTATDATVLVMGESGTGKELVARAIHALSPRADPPFIPVNCGAIPAELLESEMFGRNAFREDLFYRLNVIPIVMPPLRERRSDIPILIDHFLEKQNRKRPERRVQFNDEAMVLLWEYDWPGNVRELENLIERVVILSEDTMIGVESLPSSVREFIWEKRIPKPPTHLQSGLDLNGTVEWYENRLIDEALTRAKGNKQAAARLLGLKRTTLVAKLNRRTVVATFEAEQDYLQ
jgi:transcriptional regulator with PAS, ATPase and Fis domain